MRKNAILKENTNGGEEFSILLPRTTSEEAEIIADRIRKRVSETEFPNRRVTVSIGIASSSLALNSVENLISAADKALYQAQRRGRNNVQVFEKMKEQTNMNREQILSTLFAEDFIGRTAELDFILRHAKEGMNERGLIVLSAPGTGASEFFRQIYDQLFYEESRKIPFYFR